MLRNRFPRALTSRTTTTGLTAIRPLRAYAPLHHTTQALFLPPQIARVLALGGMVAVQAFFAAHREEAARLAKEEQKGESQTNSNSSAQHDKPAEETSELEDPSMNPEAYLQMPPEEALQILGMSPNLAVPLRSSEDRAKAKANFELHFSRARESGNLYLQGKISAAYRRCADSEWDASSQVNPQISEKK